jgi:hypothetical protein
MSTPFEILEDPAGHLSLLTTPTDDEFEHQHLDRKLRDYNASFRNRTLMEDRNREGYNPEFLEAAVSPTEDVVPGADSTDQRDTKVEV